MCNTATSPKHSWDIPRAKYWDTAFQYYVPLVPWHPGICSTAMQMSVWNSAKISPYFMACSAQMVELESSCAWPCAQWAGAGGDGSSHMEELNKRFPWRCICPFNPHLYSWTRLLKWRQFRKLFRNCLPYKTFMLQRQFLENLPEIVAPGAETNMCLGLSCNMS